MAAASRTAPGAGFVQDLTDEVPLERTEEVYGLDDAT